MFFFLQALGVAAIPVLVWAFYQGFKEKNFPLFLGGIHFVFVAGCLFVLPATRGFSIIGPLVLDLPILGPVFYLLFLTDSLPPDSFLARHWVYAAFIFFSVLGTLQWFWTGRLFMRFLLRKAIAKVAQDGPYADFRLPKKKVRRATFFATILATIFLIAATGSFFAWGVSSGARQDVFGFEAAPSFSADDRRIVFCGSRFDRREVYSTNIDGTRLRKLTTQGESFDPSFSPDGSRIVFVSTRDHLKGELYLMDAEGTDVRRLTYNADAESHPVFSTDGKQIVFARNENELFVLNMERGSEKSTRYSGSLKNGRFHFLPDGRSILVSSQQGEMTLLDISDDVISARMQECPIDEPLTFSPDGKSYAYLKKNERIRRGKGWLRRFRIGCRGNADEASDRPRKGFPLRDFFSQR